ncbi:hypothetical protein RFI_28610 [Reticulomyxa filosa]|uniref:beta-N-acetylhexosaminidase n=1 Tax=Reticulomyxa filosa TaxID=46433 RepID=X6M456_RETFI|nr:hypothetical protein RFI_28610 [Reticulomyxa filosa]|eukprot:ETO08778.1 hypothetical protein RFI_28610 [Reticulomyxa filosa]
MDEVRFECYDNDEQVKAWLKKEHLSEGHDIYRWWADKATAIASKYKKRPIVWQEVYKNFETKVPKDTVIHLWMGKNLLRSAALNGYDILVSHGWYLDHLKTAWQDYYNNNMFEGIEHESEHYKKHVLGGEACMWSEHIDLSVLDATVWPKAAAAAENLWSTSRNIDTAFDRLEYFRCLLIGRGVGGGPLKHVNSREAPDSPHSCFQE